MMGKFWGTTGQALEFMVRGMKNFNSNRTASGGLLTFTLLSAGTIAGHCNPLLLPADGMAASDCVRTPTVWLCFCGSHTQGQIDLIGQVLLLRGLNIADFVRAWLATDDFRTAVHFLWRSSAISTCDSSESSTHKTITPQQ
jgi:hypothetical protein